MTERPTYCTNDHLEFLTQLHHRKDVHLGEMVFHLKREFGIITAAAREMALYWISTDTTRKPYLGT